MLTRQSSLGGQHHSRSRAHRRRQYKQVHTVFVYIIMASHLALACRAHTKMGSRRSYPSPLSEGWIVKISSEMSDINHIIYTHVQQCAKRFPTSAVLPYTATAVRRCSDIQCCGKPTYICMHCAWIPRRGAGYKLPRSHQGRYIRNVFIVASVG